jgi:hypothetical protein
MRLKKWLKNQWKFRGNMEISFNNYGIYGIENQPPKLGETSRSAHKNDFTGDIQKQSAAQPTHHLGEGTLKALSKNEIDALNILFGKAENEQKMYGTSKLQMDKKGVFLDLKG